MKRVKTKRSNIASHQVRRLELIQTLHRGFVTASSDELEAELTLSNLLTTCDNEAATHDDIIPYDRLRSDASLVLENAGIKVDRYRFLIPHKNRNVLGTTMFLSEIATDKGNLGKAVMHLITNPSNPQFAYLQMGTLYRVPNIDKAKPITARTLIPEIQDFLRVLGHNTKVFRHKKAENLDGYIAHDERIGKGRRFLDLSTEATIEVANQIKARLEGDYKEVRVVNRHGRYTIACKQ